MKTHIEHVLRRLQEHLPNTIIAGGYCRDTFLNHQYKDVDLFLSERDLQINRISECEFYDYFIHELFDDLLIRKTTSDDRMFIDPALFHNTHPSSGINVDSVYNVSYREIPFQFIIVKDDPVEHVKANFDLDICQIWWKGNSFEYTPEFINAVNKKCISINPNIGANYLLKTEARIAYLTKKLGFSVDRTYIKLRKKKDKNNNNAFSKIKMQNTWNIDTDTYNDFVASLTPTTTGTATITTTNPASEIEAPGNWTTEWYTDANTPDTNQ